jgi:hypothetical protein
MEEIVEALEADTDAATAHPDLQGEGGIEIRRYVEDGQSRRFGYYKGFELFFDAESVHSICQLPNDDEGLREDFRQALALKNGELGMPAGNEFYLVDGGTVDLTWVSKPNTTFLPLDERTLYLQVDGYGMEDEAFAELEDQVRNEAHVRDEPGKCFRLQKDEVTALI